MVPQLYDDDYDHDCATMMTTNHKEKKTSTPVVGWSLAGEAEAASFCLPALSLIVHRSSCFYWRIREEVGRSFHRLEGSDFFFIVHYVILRCVYLKCPHLEYWPHCLSNSAVDLFVNLNGPGINPPCPRFFYAVGHKVISPHFYSNSGVNTDISIQRPDQIHRPF